MSAAFGADVKSAHFLCRMSNLFKNLVSRFRSHSEGGDGDKKKEEKRKQASFDGPNGGSHIIPRQSPKNKSKESAVVSEPFNLKQVAHVTKDFDWNAQPEEIFDIDCWIAYG